MSEFQSIDRSGDNTIKWKTIDPTDINGLITTGKITSSLLPSTSSLALANGVNTLTLGTVSDITSVFGDSHMVISSDNTNDTLTMYNGADRSDPKIRIDKDGIVWLFNDFNLGGNVCFSSLANELLITSGVYLEMDEQPADCASKSCLKMGGYNNIYNNSGNGMFHCISANSSSLADAFYYELNHVQKFKIDYNGNVICNGVTIGSLNGYLKSSSGVVSSSSTIATSDLSGTVAVANGGTNLSSYTVGDLVYASGTTTLASLADVATGNVLISGGVTTAPSYGKVGLTTHVSGTLPVANGGTNLTSYTTGDLVYSSATNVLSKLAIGSSGQILKVSSGIPAWTAGTAVDRGYNNLIVGDQSVTAPSMTNGSGTYNNTIVGNYAGASLTSGGMNTVLGRSAGGTNLSTCWGNIVLGDEVSIPANADGQFVAGWSASGLNKVFFKGGIRGVTTGNNDAVNVMIDSAGQLGTVSSSERYKTDIQNVDTNMLDALYSLSVKKYHYTTGCPCKYDYGIIAESLVGTIFEDDLLVKSSVCTEQPNYVTDNDGNQVQRGTIQVPVDPPQLQAETVMYNKLVPLLLAEIQRLNARLTTLENK